MKKIGQMETVSACEGLRRIEVCAGQGYVHVSAYQAVGQKCLADGCVFIKGTEIDAVIALLQKAKREMQHE